MKKIFTTTPAVQEETAPRFPLPSMLSVPQYEASKAHAHAIHVQSQLEAQGEMVPVVEYDQFNASTVDGVDLWRDREKLDKFIARIPVLPTCVHGMMSHIVKNLPYDLTLISGDKIFSTHAWHVSSPLNFDGSEKITIPIDDMAIGDKLQHIFESLNFDVVKVHPNTYVDDAFAKDWLVNALTDEALLVLHLPPLPACLHSLLQSYVDELPKAKALIIGSRVFANEAFKAIYEERREALWLWFNVDDLSPDADMFRIDFNRFNGFNARTLVTEQEKAKRRELLQSISALQLLMLKHSR